MVKPLKSLLLSSGVLAVVLASCDVAQDEVLSSQGSSWYTWEATDDARTRAYDSSIYINASCFHPVDVLLYDAEAEDFILMGPNESSYSPLMTMDFQ